jgi:hypothetical protein
MEKLPFNCCALSFTPFEDPVCTADGTVFDIANIVPYINKHHTSPVTGEPLDLDELISLKFHKNGEGEYECPVMKKVFNQVCENRIVVIQLELLPNFRIQVTNKLSEAFALPLNRVNKLSV